MRDRPAGLRRILQPAGRPGCHPHGSLLQQPHSFTDSHSRQLISSDIHLKAEQLTQTVASMLAVASAHHHPAPSSTMASAAASSSSSSSTSKVTATNAAGSLAIDAAAASTSAQHSVSPALVSSPVGGVQQSRLPKALHIRDEFYGPFTITEVGVAFAQGVRSL